MKLKLVGWEPTCDNMFCANSEKDWNIVSQDIIDIKSNELVLWHLRSNGLEISKETTFVYQTDSNATRSKLD